SQGSHMSQVKKHAALTPASTAQAIRLFRMLRGSMINSPRAKARRLQATVVWFLERALAKVGCASHTFARRAARCAQHTLQSSKGVKRRGRNCNPRYGQCPRTSLVWENG